MKKKWIAAVVTTVGVLGSVAGILQWLESRKADVPRTSVKASGDGSIAAGNDVRIGERTVVDKHDFGADRRDEAERYVRLARETCRGLSDRISAMTAESSIDMTQLQQFYPPELHPNEIVAEHYGEQVYANINAKLDEALRHFQAAVRPLVANSIRGMTGMAARPKKQAEERASFDVDRKAWLDSTNDLCTYLATVGA